MYLVERETWLQSALAGGDCFRAYTMHLSKLPIVYCVSATVTIPGVVCTSVDDGRKTETTAYPQTR